MATLEAIDRCQVRFVRTTQHPTADLVGPAQSFDELYERADTFDDVYEAIVERLVAAATEAEADGLQTLYAVPGSPLVLERTVRLLRQDDRVQLELIPAISFLDEVWSRLGVDPVDDGIRLVDGHRFAEQAVGEKGPMLVAHTHAQWVLSEMKLAIDAGPEQRAVILQRLGTPEEKVIDVAWPDLDRVVEADHLTSIYLPEVTAPIGSELIKTVELMHRLRQDCPWDAEQDHSSLRRYLIEESYEVLDALDEVIAEAEPEGTELGLAYEHLEEELGDLWFQILFHAELATEAGQFTIADVARTVYDKLVHRHPHVFAVEPADPDSQSQSPGEIEANWERMKRVEKGRDSAMDGIPHALPALSLTAKFLDRAERSGADVDLGPLGDAIAAAVGDVTPASIGKWLFAVVSLARAHGLDAEDTLRSTALAARDRFVEAERNGPVPTNWALG